MNRRQFEGFFIPLIDLGPTFTRITNTFKIDYKREKPVLKRVLKELSYVKNTKLSQEDFTNKVKLIVYMINN